MRVEIASAKGLEMRMQEAGRTVPPVVVSGQSGARPERFLRETLSGCMWGTDGRGEGWTWREE